jgi:hypothetical protein
MREYVKRELFVAVQYFVILILTVVLAFNVEMSQYSGDGSHINMSEAWKNVEPYVRQVLLVFAVLSTLRFAVVSAAFYIGHRRK